MDETTDASQNDAARFVQRQAINRSGCYMLLFFFSLLFLNFEEDTAARAGRPTVQDQIDAIKYEKSLLANVTFGQNISHPTPALVQQKVEKALSKGIKDPLDIGVLPVTHFYHNVTGIFRGEWMPTNVTVPENNVPDNNATSPEKARGDFPYDQPGSFTLNMKSEHTKEDRVKFVEGFIRLQNDERGDFGVLMVAEGVHFVNNGTLYMTAVPENHHMPTEDLLHMLPSNSTMNQGREVLQEQLSLEMEELQKVLDWSGQGYIDSDRSMPNITDCTFEFWMQLHPVDGLMSEVLEYERELENPQGINVRYPGPFMASMVMYSANCEIVMEMDDSNGIKIEKYYKKAISYATLASVVAFIQIFLLIHQMEYTPTPSSVSNISYWTIAMQSTMDGYLCLIHLTTGVVVQNVFIPFATTAFFTFVLVSIFGMRYLMVIWRIQRPEAAHREQAAATQNAARTNSPAGDAINNAEATARTTSTLGGILPMANTTARPAVRTVQDERREDALLYYRFYLVFLLGLFIFYQTASKSTFVQNIVVGVLAFGLFSFWVPQIYRNVIRGSRRALSRRYVIGMSLTRLVIPLYYYACPHNILAHESTKWVWVLAAYVMLQVAVLMIQDVWDPRFFVPERYLPERYNYHPILPNEDEETNVDVKVVGVNASEEAESSEGQSKHAPGRDCAICMLPVNATTQGSAGLQALGRATYMVTPCHHLFHTECLEKWMRIKLECPVCRAYLPAV
ncbi:hypothetical protein K450DRAFT_226893 [Umbelopsis ramanniana AG]|uniref:RING-type E3 ubiquitin transferase n=1 Tax=Umbelopsis ramanniana AG TaxID=1314678 RepID=A0AAD5EGV4_UMBRA|nr:uncharacterized protein K450DRAFT_226893 [Umbelopsis ramanniana AG]KAI8582785.1 hypothetical protein K450DRAFT_226893 [Umbelopsis ramanniana AG]